MKEHLILNNLLTNDSYMRKVVPFLKKTYFEGVPKLIFAEISSYVSKYNKLPTRDALTLQIEESETISESNYNETVSLIPELFEKRENDAQWLLDTTEKWCQDRAVLLAIMESIQVIDGKHRPSPRTPYPTFFNRHLVYPLILV